MSAEAALHRQAGNRVFDFHIGDLNFSTPPHICQALKQAIDDGKTNYCPARGVRPLAETLARVIGEERGVVFEPDQVRKFSTETLRFETVFTLVTELLTTQYFLNIIIGRDSAWRKACDFQVHSVHYGRRR